MIRQNRAVPILLVLTFAFILYLGGCFGSEEESTAAEEEPTPAVVATPTPAPVVTTDIDPSSTPQEPFFHTVEDGDRLGSIASKYGVTSDVILLANPDLNPNLLIVGEQLRIPGATTNNEEPENSTPDRDEGITVNYVVEPGDTLGAIANTWTVSLDALLGTNPDVDPSNLQVNQLLVIPPWGTGIDAADLEARSTPVPQTRAPGQIQTHIVEPGDFLQAIAETYFVLPSEIVEANALPDGGNNLQVGQELLIPVPSQGQFADDPADSTQADPATDGSAGNAAENDEAVDSQEPADG